MKIYNMDDMLKYEGIDFLAPEVVLAILGGEWPDEQDGFCFEAVEVFKLEGECLVPYDGTGEGAAPCPGPNFKLIYLVERRDQAF